MVNITPFLAASIAARVARQNMEKTRIEEERARLRKLEEAKVSRNKERNSAANVHRT